MKELLQIVENLSDVSRQLRQLISQTPDAHGTRLREGVLRLEAAIYYTERAIAEAARAA